MDINQIFNDTVNKMTKYFSTKQAKKTNQNLQWLEQKLKSQISSALKISQHFKERVVQRFSEDEKEKLASAISRSIRNTKPLEVRGMHLAKAQKFIDEATNFVIVLERMGEFGATLITSFVLGKENLLSDEEIYELKMKGIL
ncbi:hypothetical protein [Helicobacter sp. 13S00482-2]|uniref:hypothetical protein n=1 Tax=Helicobacter sp. 13S00482-2 TaxID=1476200 RepID=UPI001179D4B9|nr:hypothetical protein [Helicobacter sp. 13S00482-2]